MTDTDLRLGASSCLSENTEDILDAALFLEYTQPNRLGVTHPGDCIP